MDVTMEEHGLLASSALAEDTTGVTMEERSLLASSVLAEDKTNSGERLLASSVLAEDATLEGHGYWQAVSCQRMRQ
jgi:hypothetical protein